MHPSLSASAFLPLLLCSFFLPSIRAAIQQPPLSTLILYHSAPTPLPVSNSPSPPTNLKTLAILAYLPSRPYLSTLQSFSPPANTSNSLSSLSKDSLTQIITYHPSNNNKNDDSQRAAYRSTSTTTSSFHAPAQGRFRLTVAPDGSVVSASWRSWLPKDSASSSQTQRKEGNIEGVGDFDLITLAPPPTPIFDRPAPKTQGAGGSGAGGGGNGAGGDGEGEGEVQEEKTIFQRYWWVLVAVALLAMTGGGGDK